MIAAIDVGANFGAADSAGSILRNDKIVYTPSGVSFPCAHAVGPPGVCSCFIRMQVAKAVYKSGLQQAGELVAFLIGKTGAVMIALRVFQVYFLMSNIQISAVEHSLALAELGEIVSHIVFKFHALIYAGQTILRIGDIAVYQEKVGVFQSHYPAFVQMQTVDAVR